MLLAFGNNKIKKTCEIHLLHMQTDAKRTEIVTAKWDFMSVS